MGSRNSLDLASHLQMSHSPFCSLFSAVILGKRDLKERSDVRLHNCTIVCPTVPALEVMAYTVKCCCFLCD